MSRGKLSSLHDSFSHEPLYWWFTFHDHLLRLCTEIGKKGGKSLFQGTPRSKFRSLRGQGGSCEKNFSGNAALLHDHSYHDVHHRATDTQAQLTRFTKREALHHGSLQSRKLRHCSKPSSLRFLFPQRHHSTPLSIRSKESNDPSGQPSPSSLPSRCLRRVSSLRIFVVNVG